MISNCYISTNPGKFTQGSHTVIFVGLYHHEEHLKKQQDILQAFPDGNLCSAACNIDVFSIDP